jgi:DedD protein
MDKLKEILFGFIVIAALGVIFVPMLFTDQKGSKEAVTSVPPKPVEYKLAQAQSQSKEHALTELKETAHPEPVVVDQPIHDEPKPATQAIVKHENISATATPTPQPQQTLASAATKQEPVQELKQESKHEAKQQPVQEPKHEAKQEPKQELKQEVPAVPAEKSVIPSAPESTQIKEPPVIPETPTVPPKPKAKELIHPSHTDAPVTKPSEHEKVQTAPQKKAPSEPKKSKPVTSGWVVQVGTFAVHDNAINLVKKLKRNGFPAYTKNLYRSGQNLTVVLVGPHSQQEAAMRTLDVIADQYGLRGEVIHFAPSKSTQEEDSQ